MENSGIRVLFEGINMIRLLGGLWITLKIALISIVLSAVLGVGFGLVMNTQTKVIKVLSRIYLEAIRIIPILVWLFIWYFGITKMLNIHIEGEVIAVLVFTLWGTGEMGDLVRGAITSLPRHQTESGRAIGLKEEEIYLYIIIPQAIRRMLPGAINLATRMIKTTSLVVLIGVIEVVKVGQQIIEISLLKNPTASFWVYGFIFILYFILCYPISLLSRKLEAKWAA
nr:amino acid ABC transporter permease [uncultured Niameybacter sp.]